MIGAPAAWRRFTSSYSAPLRADVRGPLSLARGRRKRAGAGGAMWRGIPQSIGQEIDDAVLLEIDEDGAGGALLVRRRLLLAA